MQTRNSEEKRGRQAEAWKICCDDLWGGPMHTDVEFNVFHPEVL